MLVLVVTSLFQTAYVSRDCVDQMGDSVPPTRWLSSRSDRELSMVLTPRSDLIGARWCEEGSAEETESEGRPPVVISVSHGLDPVLLLTQS